VIKWFVRPQTVLFNVFKQQICSWSYLLSASSPIAVTFSSLCARVVCRCCAFSRCDFCKLIFRKVGVATPLRCGGCRLYCKFPAECNSKRILKIGHYLAKLWTRVWCLAFIGRRSSSLCFNLWVYSKTLVGNVVETTDKLIRFSKSRWSMSRS